MLSVSCLGNTDREMKRVVCLLSVILTCSAAAAVPKGGPQYQTDTRTVKFLQRHLVSGGDIHYPLEAAKARQWGSGFYLMKLREDETIESLTVKTSSGSKALEQHAMRTLKAYRFKPKTKSPLLWLVSFEPPATVIVKAQLVDESKLRLPPITFGRKVDSP